jgi:antitoxin ParD1/3/4
MRSPKLSISLPKSFEHFVSSEVASGRFRTPSEVVREGLRLLREQDKIQQAALKSARRKIDAGLAQAKRGKLIDGEAVFAALERRAQRPRRAAG